MATCWYLLCKSLCICCLISTFRIPMWKMFDCLGNYPFWHKIDCYLLQLGILLSNSSVVFNRFQSFFRQSIRSSSKQSKKAFIGGKQWVGNLHKGSIWPKKTEQNELTSQFDRSMALHSYRLTTQCNLYNRPSR